MIRCKCLGKPQWVYVVGLGIVVTFEISCCHGQLCETLQLYCGVLRASISVGYLQDLRVRVWVRYR
jgi:hypothetical protein